MRTLVDLEHLELQLLQMLLKSIHHFILRLSMSQLLMQSYTQTEIVEDVIEHGVFACSRSFFIDAGSPDTASSFPSI